MFVPIAEEEWLLQPGLDPDRAARLWTSLRPIDVLNLVVEGATQCAQIHLSEIDPCSDSRHRKHYRYGVRIALPPETFDLFFNSRAGYRAQYYRSPECGKAYNDSAIQALIPIVRHVHGAEACWNEVARSLSGLHSKLYVVGDRHAFDEAEIGLAVSRWAKGNAYGLRVPLPPPPQLDLKGTFIHQSESAYDNKMERSSDLHLQGYT